MIGKTKLLLKLTLCSVLVTYGTCKFSSLCHNGDWLGDDHPGFSTKDHTGKTHNITCGQQTAAMLKSFPNIDLTKNTATTCASYTEAEMGQLAYVGLKCCASGRHLCVAPGQWRDEASTMKTVNVLKLELGTGHPTAAGMVVMQPTEVCRPKISKTTNKVTEYETLTCIDATEAREDKFSDAGCKTKTGSNVIKAGSYGPINISCVMGVKTSGYGYENRYSTAQCGATNLCKRDLYATGICMPFTQKLVNAANPKGWQSMYSSRTGVRLYFSDTNCKSPTWQVNTPVGLCQAESKDKCDDDKTMATSKSQGVIPYVAGPKKVTTVKQAVTFTNLATAADYKGVVKKTYELAYGKANGLTTTTGTIKFLPGATVTSMASRRAAKVTFTATMQSTFKGTKPSIGHASGAAIATAVSTVVKNNKVTGVTAPKAADLTVAKAEVETKTAASSTSPSASFGFLSLAAAAIMASMRA